MTSRLKPSTIRAHPRRVLRLAAEISLPGKPPFTAATRDLSAGGTCIEAPYPLPDQGEIGLSLFVVVDDVEEATLPPLQLVATVQWTATNDDAATDARHLAGLRFAGLTAAQAKWLASFLPPT